MRSSSIPTFVFCHGWGFNPHFWQRLSPYFKAIGGTCYFMDLGYGHEKESKMSLPSSTDTEIQYIGIGHSLGLVKLLSLPLPYRALIGLQSFINFLGFDRILRAKRQRALNILCKNFQAHPQATLDQFYQTCTFGIKNPEKDIWHMASPNFRSLSQDLATVSHTYSLPFDIPLLILGTSGDKVVPPALIYDNFATTNHVSNTYIDLYDAEGHTLGYHHPEIVSKKILDFVHAHSKR